MRSGVHQRVTRRDYAPSWPDRRVVGLQGGPLAVKVGGLVIAWRSCDLR